MKSAYSPQDPQDTRCDMEKAWKVLNARQFSQLKQSAVSSAILIAQVNQVIVKHEAQNLHSNKKAQNSQHLTILMLLPHQTFTFKDHPLKSSSLTQVYHCHRLLYSSYSANNINTLLSTFPIREALLLPKSSHKQSCQVESCPWPTEDYQLSLITVDPV